MAGYHFVVISVDAETADVTEFPYTLHMECALPLLTCKEYTQSFSKDHFTSDSGIATTASKGMSVNKHAMVMIILSLFRKKKRKYNVL